MDRFCTSLLSLYIKHIREKRGSIHTRYEKVIDYLSIDFTRHIHRLWYLHKRYTLRESRVTSRRAPLVTEIAERDRRGPPSWFVRKKKGKGWLRPNIKYRSFIWLKSKSPTEAFVCEKTNGKPILQMAIIKNCIRFGERTSLFHFFAGSEGVSGRTQQIHQYSKKNTEANCDLPHIPMGLRWSMVRFEYHSNIQRIAKSNHKRCYFLFLSYTD